MHGLILAAALAITGTHTDTTLAVTAGTRLALENFGGSIVVTAWSRNAVRIEADHRRRTTIEVVHDRDEITVSAENERMVPVSVDYRLTVPAWMGLQLSGVNCDIKATGLRGPFEAETVQGDIDLQGGSGRVRAESVQGQVSVADVSGELEIRSVNEAVWIEGVSGTLTAESVNGPVTVVGAKLRSLEASTVNGTIRFEGSFERDGRYELSTHNGAVYVAVPATADLHLEAETYDGTFHSTFPVERDNTQRRRRTVSATFGRGGADLVIESFRGPVSLYRPGETVWREHGDETPDRGAKEKGKDRVKGKNEGDREREDPGARDESGSN